jgi:molybdopterin-guanine dinucleotide biosynthesis protein A
MTRPTGVTAIVLAGGRSSRFGGQKLAAEVDGVTLLDHAIGAVRALADEIIVAGPASLAPAPTMATTTTPAPPIRTLADEESFAGPLAALAGALRVTRTDLAIVVGGDMPGLVTSVLEAMLGRLAPDDDLDGVLLASEAPEPQHRHVLPLALRVTTAFRAADEALSAGDRSLVRLLDRLRVDEVPAAEWLALDPNARTVLDVDRPDDLEGIRHNLR